MPKVNLPDGTYQVQHENIYAGFTVKDGEVVQCAPILRKRISFWATKATRIRTDESKTNQWNDRGGSAQIRADQDKP